MAVSHQESDLQYGSDNAEDEGLTGNCSVSSSRELHDDRFSSTCVSGDNVFTSVNYNSSTSGRPTGNVLSGTDSSLESDKGDMSHLGSAVANLDICRDNSDNRKLSLPRSTEEHEQHEYVRSWLHHEKDIKTDLVCKPTDEVPEEEREGYPEVTHGSACSAQFQLHGGNSENGLCNPDLHISVNSNASVNGPNSESPCAHGADVSEPALCNPYGTDAVGLFTCNGAQDATETISCRNRNEAEAKIHRIATEKSVMNYVSLHNEGLMLSLVISKPETMKMNVDCGKASTELIPIESISVSQSYAPGISLMRENKVNTTSSFDSDVSFSQTVPRCVDELSEDISASASQSSIPSLPIGISTLAVNVPLTGTCSHDTSTSISDSSVPEPATVHPQLDSSCSNSKNIGAISKYVTCPTDMNYTLQGLTDNSEFSVGVHVFSRPLASETALIQDVPLKCSVSFDSCILRNTNKSSVLDSFSRESSVFTGITFCTLGSPILSSSISGLFNTSFPLSATSSALDRGGVFKCMAPCTESAMAPAGRMGNTYLKPGFTTEADMCSDTVHTPVQNTKCSMTMESSGLPAVAFVNSEKLSLPTLTNNVFSLPSTASMSIGLFGQKLGFKSVSSSISSTKATNGFQFGKHTSMSVTGTGTTFTGFHPHSSKLGFGSHIHSPKHEPLQNASLTKSAFANGFPVNTTGDQKSPGRSSGSAARTSRSSSFPFGSTELKESDGISVLDRASTFQSAALFSPSNCNSSAFGFGTSSAASPSHNALFNFTGSACSSQSSLPRRSRRSQRFRKIVYSLLIYDSSLHLLTCRSTHYLTRTRK
jgi:hypothetical protein